MTQQIQCSCVSRFAAAAHLAGKTLPSPACGHSLHIPNSPQALVGLTPITPMEPTTVACACGQRFAAEPRLAEQQVACPNCRRPLLIAHSERSGVGCGADLFGSADGGSQFARAFNVSAPTPHSAFVRPEPDDESLTTPVKFAIGVGGGAVALLLIGIFVSSFVGSSATGESALVSVSSESTAGEPASESTLSSVSSFVSELVTGKPKTYATPQAVFDAFWRVRDDKDMMALLCTIAPDQQELIVAEAIRQLVIVRQTQPEVTKGMDKYGLDFESISPDNTTSAWRELAAKVQNPAKFFQVASDRLAKARDQIAKAQLEKFKAMAEAARQTRSENETTDPPGMNRWQPSGPRSRRQLTAEEREEATS